jgi:hypothetical protein
VRPPTINVRRLQAHIVQAVQGSYPWNDRVLFHPTGRLKGLSGLPGNWHGCVLRGPGDSNVLPATRRATSVSEANIYQAHPRIVKGVLF